MLELEPTPPANEFVRSDAPEQEKFPLYLARCRSCGHVQLPVVVDPQRLFGSYVYVSGTSPAFVEHFRRYAESLIRELELQPGDLVVDVGSNDGTLLRFFKEAGMRVIGVDPAEDIAARATEAGIETYPCFFDRKVARTIHAKHGPAALVVANNVFAHADDLHEIALAARDMLDLNRGRFVFEVQYLVDLVEKCLFDMVYHEHLSYHSLEPLLPFFQSIAMSVVDVEHVETHGGSIRVTVSPRKTTPASSRVEGFLRIEEAALADDAFAHMKRKIEEARNLMFGFFEEERRAGHIVVGYGAPAKLTTLCYEFGITRRDVAVVFDDSPWKQGLLTPGTLIPVGAPLLKGADMLLPVPNSVVIFAWNFAEPIAAKLRGAGFKGRIVAPLPTFKEFDL